MRTLVVIIFALAFSACNSHLALVEAKQSKLRVDRSAEGPHSHALDSIIAPYKAQLDAQMGVVIGKAAQTLSKQKPESTLGNWMAEAVLRQAQKQSRKPIDFSVQNYGGIRIPELAAGDIAVGKIYELMPFDNALVIAEVSGSVVQQFLDVMAADGGWPITASVRYVIKDNKATQVSINGLALKEDKTYTIALPDYIANGNSDCDFLIDTKKNYTADLIRDLLIADVKEHQRKGEAIDAKITRRVSY